MTDPVSAISAIAGVAKAIDPEAKTADLSTSLWGDVLGPPAKALGRHFEKQVERWSESAEARRVLQLAARKSDPSTPGGVPPRVAAAVLDAAQYSDDEFVAEYLSGVLASSRTQTGKDDRGVAWSALVGRLSSDALRLHYILFSILREKMRGRDMESDAVLSWCKRHMVVRYDDLLPALGFDTTEEGADRALDAAYALQREGLIADLAHGTPKYAGGPPFAEQPYVEHKLPPGGLLIVSTTIQGIQLFLQGHGYGGVWASALAEEDRPFDTVGDVDHSVAQVPGEILEGLPKSDGGPRDVF